MLRLQLVERLNKDERNNLFYLQIVTQTDRNRLIAVN